MIDQRLLLDSSNLSYSEILAESHHNGMNPIWQPENSEHSAGSHSEFLFRSAE
jgi:hypothetical protein